MSKQQLCEKHGKPETVLYGPCNCYVCKLEAERNGYRERVYELKTEVKRLRGLLTQCGIYLRLQAKPGNELMRDVDAALDLGNTVMDAVATTPRQGGLRP